MARATKTKSGKYRCLASKSVFGNRIRKSFTAPTKKEAERLAAAWEMEDIRREEKMPLGQAIDSYIEMKNNVLSPSTIKGYLNIRNYSFPSLIRMPLKSITDIDIQYAINSLASNHSPKSVRNAYGLLSAVMKMFRPEYVLHATLPQREKTPLYIPSEADIKDILNKSKNTNLYLPLQLAIFGGLRAGEICALTYGDVNKNQVNVNKSIVCGADGVWRIKPPKSFSGNRSIVIPDSVKLGRGQKNERIVAYNPHSLSQAYHKFLIRNGFPLHRFHDLRHFYVSTLFDMGVPEKYIIAQVGHSSASITKRVYDHISQERRQDFARQITQKFANY